jgi:hypothetical protein
MLRLTIARAGYSAVGIGALLLTAGFAFASPWVTWLWPWPDGPLSYLFVASILAAFGVGSLLTVLTQDWRGVAGGAIALLIGFGGMAMVLVQRGATGHAIGFAAISATGAAMLYWGLRDKARDARPIPLFVRLSFGIFTLALLLAGIALILRMPFIFPWPLKPETSLLYGLMFVGLCLNYLYVALFGSWSDAKVSLLGFLAYDLVLIAPFLKLFASVHPDHRMSLVVYTAVLIYSGTLAIAYLGFSPRWRLGAQQAYRHATT